MSEERVDGIPLPYESVALSRRKFTKDFKEEAFRRLNLEASLAEVARACEVNPNVLRGWEAHHKGVYWIMREDNLLCSRRRKFVVTTDSITAGA